MQWCALRLLASAAVVVSGGSRSTAASLDTSITQKIAVPSYINPLADPDAWARLATSSPGTVGFAVANVINGPDYFPLDEWSEGDPEPSARAASASSATSTPDISARPDSARASARPIAIDWMSQIQHDIDTWYKFYGSSLSGIFFDQMQNACGPTPDSNEWADLYGKLTDDVERLHPGALTVLNPGTDCAAVLRECGRRDRHVRRELRELRGRSGRGEPLHAVDVDADGPDEDLAHRLRRARHRVDVPGGRARARPEAPATST